MENTPVKQKSAQDIQDEIFMNMPADEKVALGSLLWKLAYDLAADKITYGANRPAKTPNRDNGHS